jgi:hypothetical protein
MVDEKRPRITTMRGPELIDRSGGPIVADQ